VVIWSPGDGNDTVDGGVGSDEVQLNLSADVAGSVTVKGNPGTTEFPDGYFTVTGGAGADAFELTLGNVETLRINIRDQDDKWLEERILSLVTEGEPVNPEASFTFEDFSAPMDQDAFDTGAPDTSVDFLI
jgi:hypothetical protein